MTPTQVLQRVIPFVIGLLLGLLPAYFLSDVPQPAAKPSHSASGSAHGWGQSGGDYGPDSSDAGRIHHKGDEVLPATRPYRIFSKPQAKYTDLARENNVQGKVRLKVKLNSDGTVGSASVVNGLPDGLTEQAIAAARLIKFDPAMVNNVPVAKTITIDYSFTIY